MNYAIILASLAVCGWMSLYSTGQFVLFALRRQVIDVPNSRSSHSFATPRGGGIAFAVVFLVAIASLGVTGHLLPNELIGLLSGIALVAVGFADDCKGMGIGVRFGVQIVASTVCAVSLGSGPLHLAHFSGIALCLILLAVVFASTWTINLVNFMDGIDGLAATETITVAGACFLMVSARHGITTVSLLFGLLAAVVTGFLLWNWHPAQVFMGDAGSCFVGYSFVAMTFLAAERHQLSLLTPFFLLGVFIIDASMTLIKRMLRREQWYRPHRMHGFQHASKVIGHRRTTLSVAAINLLWLTPWACLAEFRPGNRWLYLACAWLPIITLAHLLHSGEPLAAGASPRWRSLSAFKRAQFLRALLYALLCSLTRSSPARPRSR